MSKSSKHLIRQRFDELKSLINQYCFSNDQISNPLATAISRFPNYFRHEDSNIMEFVQSLIMDENHEFYQKLSKNFDMQEDKENVEFLLISCFLRDFLTAKIPKDLQITITYAGFAPKMIVDVHNAKTYEEKEDLKTSFIHTIDKANQRDQTKGFLLDYLPLNQTEIILQYLNYEEEMAKVVDNFLKFSDKDAIITNRNKFLKCSKLENVPDDLNLKGLQGIVIEEIKNLNQEEIGNPIEKKEDKTKSPLVIHTPESSDLDSSDKESSNDEISSPEASPKSTTRKRSSSSEDDSLPPSKTTKANATKALQNLHISKQKNQEEGRD